MAKKRKKEPEQAKDECVLTLRELAFHIGTNERLIERLIRLELLEPIGEEPETCFSTDILPRVEKLMRLHYSLGVSWSSMDLVLELLDRIEELEDQL